MTTNYFSSLQQPNSTVPSLLKSLTPKQQTPLTNTLSKMGTKTTTPQTLPAGPQSMLPTSTKTTPTTSPAKDYTKFTDADWLAYQANKPKPVVKQAPVQNNAVVDNSMGTANQNANYFGNMSQTSNTQAGSTQTAPAIQSTQQPDTSYGGLVRSIYNKAQDRSEVDKANQGLLDLRKQYSTAVGNIESTPIPLEFQQGRAQVLGRQYASQEAAQQQALSNALNIRGQDIGALTTAANLASPRTADLYVDPRTGQPIGNVNNLGGQLAQWNAVRTQGALGGQFTQQYEEGLANLRAADSIGNQIKSTIASNPTINNQPLAAWTNIKQLLSAQFSDPAQQKLAMEVNQYIQTLGLDSNTVINIASQQQGTLGQLLDSLRAQAEAKIEAYNPQNIINQGGSQTGGGLFDW